MVVDIFASLAIIALVGLAFFIVKVGIDDCKESRALRKMEIEFFEKHSRED